MVAQASAFLSVQLCKNMVYQKTLKRQTHYFVAFLMLKLIYRKVLMNCCELRPPFAEVPEYELRLGRTLRISIVNSTTKMLCKVSIIKIVMFR